MVGFYDKKLCVVFRMSSKFSNGWCKDGKLCVLVRTSRSAWSYDEKLGFVFRTSSCGWNWYEKLCVVSG